MEWIKSKLSGKKLKTAVALALAVLLCLSGCVAKRSLNETGRRVVMESHLSQESTGVFEESAVESSGLETLASTEEGSAQEQAEDVVYKDIAVYGNGAYAVFSACKAAGQAPGKKVLLIVPDVSGMLGGVASAGGQNFWDTRDSSVNMGSFTFFYADENYLDRDYTGMGYNPTVLSERLKATVAGYPNLEVMYSKDIYDLTVEGNPAEITSLSLMDIYRSADGSVLWAESGRLKVMTGTVIDASDSGRITRKASGAVTVGRYDWPQEYLDVTDSIYAYAAKQSAATLMIKLKGITSARERGTGDLCEDDMNWGYYNADFADEADCLWGGGNAYNSEAVTAFNNKYSSSGYVLKPVNAARNGPGSDEWWVNALIIFNVDGRAEERDRSPDSPSRSFYPEDILPGSKSVDSAWKDAKSFLEGSAGKEFLEAIRHYTGFENADFVYERSGEIAVGEMLYLRETVHLSTDRDERAVGSENANYGLTTYECRYAGNELNEDPVSPWIAAPDFIGNHSARIGLAFYNIDVHPYAVMDIKDSETGQYLLGDMSLSKMRPDLISPADGSGPNPENPVYLPYSAMTTQYVQNLLVCGFAVSASSCAWCEIRTVPNLCVLGDAAGVAAAYCEENNMLAYELKESDINAIQQRLLALGARLDK